MGVSRIRPSRIIIDTGDIKASLPDTLSERTTIEITGVPNRGIIHGARFVYTNTSALNDAGVDLAIIHTSGTAATSTATALPAADALSALIVCSFTERAPLGTGTGNIAIPASSFILNTDLLNQYEGVAEGGASIRTGPVAYDVSGGVLGPDANDGKLYFTLAAFSQDYTALGSAKLVLEIEPAY